MPPSRVLGRLFCGSWPCMITFGVGSLRLTFTVFMKEQKRRTGRHLSLLQGA